MRNLTDGEKDILAEQERDAYNNERLPLGFIGCGVCGDAVAVDDADEHEVDIDGMIGYVYTHPACMLAG